MFCQTEMPEISMRGKRFVALMEDGVLMSGELVSGADKQSVAPRSDYYPKGADPLGAQVLGFGWDEEREQTRLHLRHYDTDEMPAYCEWVRCWFFQTFAPEDADQMRATLAEVADENIERRWAAVRPQVEWSLTDVVGKRAALERLKSHHVTPDGRVSDVLSDVGFRKIQLTGVILSKHGVCWLPLPNTRVGLYEVRSVYADFLNDTSDAVRVLTPYKSRVIKGSMSF